MKVGANPFSLSSLGVSPGELLAKVDLSGPLFLLAFGKTAASAAGVPLLDRLLSSVP